MKRIEKPWGHELIWTVNDAYAGKLISIRDGKRLSLQYHRQKRESVFVISGELHLHLQNEAGDIEVHIIPPGEAADIPEGRIHRFEAVGDTDVIEVSTPQLDDVVRLEDDFGREGTSAP